MLEVSNAANKLNIHLLLSFVHLLQNACCPMCMKSVPPAQSLWRFAHQPHRHKELRGGPLSQQPPGSPQKTSKNKGVVTVFDAFKVQPCEML